MSLDDYKERPFRLSENSDGVDGGIEFNAHDSGKTETAWVDIVDDETESLRARVSVQVNKQPIPHTEDEQRILSESNVSVELFDADSGDDVSDEVSEKLLDETDAVQHLQRICSDKDQSE